MSKLHEKAVLVNLTISQFTARKEDKRATKEVEQIHNAQSGAGKYQKLLLNKESMKEIQTIAGKARTFHYENTLPWGDEGMRILPTKRYMEYVGTMKNLESEFSIKSSELVQNLPDMILEAEQRLGSLFDRNEYPTQQEMEEKYKFSFRIYPIPDKDDFRISLNEAEINSMKNEMEDTLKEIQENAMKSVWQRLYQVVKKMENTLKEEDKQFHKSLINNIKELCEILPDLNLTEDKNLEDMAKEIMENLTDTDAETLRTEKDVRKSIAEKAEEISKKMEGYL